MKKIHYIALGLIVTTQWTSCSNPPEGDKTDGAMKICPVHGTKLRSNKGFTFGSGVMADPSWDYVRFMDETRFPNTIPWEFSGNRTDICTQPISIEYCPTCETEFQHSFAKFQRMTEAEKEAIFVESLRIEAEKKKQNKPHHDNP